MGAGLVTVACEEEVLPVVQTLVPNAMCVPISQAVKAPPQLLPAWLRHVFTFLMPMFLFTYYPAAAACGWGGSQLLGWLALPLCGLFFGAAHVFWRVGVRHYKSTGS